MRSGIARLLGGTALVAGLALAMVSQAAAEKVSVEDLLGKWCGETSNYTFSRKSLTVMFHAGGQRVLEVDRFETGEGWINVFWKEKRADGLVSNTVFTEFSPDRNVMHQSANKEGDMGPKRRFRRC